MTVSVQGLLPRMAAMPPKDAALISSWQTRLVVEAAEITRTEGWSSVTMARLADKVGISRQTVYNEFGSKNGLAEAMVMHELVGFLAKVEEAFQRHPGDLVAAIREAAYDVLVLAETNPLLHAILSASHGAGAAAAAADHPVGAADRGGPAGHPRQDQRVQGGSR